MKTVALALLLLVALPAEAQATPTTHNWIQNAWTIHLLYGAYPSRAQHFFDRPGSYGTGAVQDGFATTPVLRYTSEAQLEADVGSIPAGSWVLYDIEKWADTPLAEQQNPEQAMQDFASVASGAGLNVIETPARDLGLVDTTCPKQSGENLDGWYLRCDIAKYAVQACTTVCGLVVQSQVDTLNVPAYQALVNGAKADAAAGNLAAFVDAELSDNYGTPAQAYAAGSSVVVAGYFINCANSNLSWENSTLGKFKAGGY